MAPQLVLVVEDEPLIRLGLVSTLEDEGYEVIEASSASEAVEVIERHPKIGFVITDVNMPGSMDGIELAQTVRARDPSVHLIIVSGARSLSGDDLPDRAVFLSKTLSGLDAPANDGTDVDIGAARLGAPTQPSDFRYPEGGLTAPL